MSRQCGNCSECCVAIECCGTGRHEPCADLDARRRCSRYETRPEECRIFRCLWLDGYGTAEQRPDKSGVLAHLTTNNAIDGVGLNVIECRPLAFRRNRAMVAKLERARVACVEVMHHDGTVELCSSDEQYIRVVCDENGLNVPEGTERIRIRIRARQV